jgi:hypothetical protein
MPVEIFMEFHHQNRLQHQPNHHPKCRKYHHLMVLHRFMIRTVAIKVNNSNDAKRFHYLEIIL